MQISAVYWGGCAIVIGILLGLIGAMIKRHPLGILIDPRNKLSLSRLQVVLWTLLILSAFSGIALQEGKAIYMAPELWALMAISTGSAAGAIIIKSTKAGLDPDTTAAAVKAVPAQATAPLGVLMIGISHAGYLTVKAAPHTPTA